MSENRQAILTIVRMVPKGRVATYGQIARLAGVPRNSRQVGSILKTLEPGQNVPWFRIVNSRGEIADRNDPETQQSQREVLEDEQIEFNQHGRISLAKFQWDA